MFKKFLALCAMLCCTALWGEEVYVAEDDVTEQEAVGEAVGEVKEYSSSEILKMMNLKDKLDYSYESHVDIPYDLYGDNKHVNRRLSKDEQAKYYANPLAYMENIAQNDWQRAFEMSMYYQGWKPNTIFFRFDFLMLNNDFNFIPSTDDMRFKTRQVLDRAKALHWAQIAYELAEKQIEADKNSNKKSYLKLNSHKADIIKMNLLFRTEEFYIENKSTKIEKLFALFNTSKDSSQTPSIDSIIFESRFKEDSTIRSDMLDFHKYFYATVSFYLWRNYYCGFIYPKNKDFALMSIISKADDVDKFYVLYKITSGLYDKDEAISPIVNMPKLGNVYRRKYLGTRFFSTKEKDGVSGLASPFNFEYVPKLILYATKNISLTSSKYREELTFLNPYYNKEKAIEEAKKLSSNYTFEEEYKDSYMYPSSPISDFVTLAPSYGIEEDTYNEILEIIYTAKESHFLKKDEVFSREYFGERIPLFIDYR